MNIRFKRQATIAVGILIALLATGLGGYYIGNSKANKAVQSPQSNNNINAAQGKNLYNGSDLTLTEMYDSLQGASGSDFDQRLLAYEIAIKQNESGMLRLAKEKSQQDAMKKYADIQMGQNDTVVTMLYGWQGDWGFNHH